MVGIHDKYCYQIKSEAKYIVFSFCATFLFSDTAICELGSDTCNRTLSNCTDTPGQNIPYKCECLEGYINKTAFICEDYCQHGRDTCNKNSTVCLATPGIGRHYECRCKVGYESVTNDTDTCTATPRPCNDAKLNQMCNLTKSICVDTFQAPHYYNCQCNHGYIKFNNTLDICKNYCEVESSNTCDNTTTCRATPGEGRYYRCDCLQQFVRLDNNNNTCTLAPTPCQHLNDSCNRTRSTCLDTYISPYFHSCKCLEGYTNGENDTVCLDFCENNMHTCNKTSSICQATPGNGRHFECECKHGFEKLDDVDSCTAIPRPCDEGTHSCNVTISNCINTFESPDYFDCVCSAGYLKLNNSVDKCLDLCSMNNDSCNETSTYCKATPEVGRHYECLCRSGFVRVNPNECLSNSSSQTMISTTTTTTEISILQPSTSISVSQTSTTTPSLTSTSSSAVVTHAGKHKIFYHSNIYCLCG